MTMAAHCIICIFVQEMRNGLGVNGLVVIEEININEAGRRWFWKSGWRRFQNIQSIIILKHGPDIYPKSTVFCNNHIFSNNTV
jgi:hypothetical protein